MVSVLDGGRLGAELTALGITQREFARLVGTRDAVISRAVHGQPIPLMTSFQILLGIERLRKRRRR